MENKTEFIGELQRHLSNAGHTPKRHFGRTRKLWKASPVVVALLVAAILGGAVIGGYFFTQLKINMKGTITTNGQQVASVFLWDGTMLTSNFTSVPVDIQSLNAGQYQIVTHTVKNVDNGYWLVNVSTGPEMYPILHDPLNAFYGFGISFTPNDFMITPGQQQSIAFNFSLSHEFLDPLVFGYNATDLMPFNLTVKITEVPAPQGVNDTANAALGNTVDVDVLANDLPVYTVKTLTHTTQFQEDSGNQYSSVSIVNNKVEFHTGYGCPSTLHCTYTFQDNTGRTATGVLTVHLG